MYILPVQVAGLHSILEQIEDDLGKNPYICILNMTHILSTYVRMVACLYSS